LDTRNQRDFRNQCCCHRTLGSRMRTETRSARNCESESYCETVDGSCPGYYASAQESDNLPEKARFLRGGFVASLRG
jgi:hypothetical protein